jgi:hypothetical protein
MVLATGVAVAVSALFRVSREKLEVRERDMEEQAEVEVVAQAPPTVMPLPLLQLERKNM